MRSSPVESFALFPGKKSHSAVLELVKSFTLVESLSVENVN